MPRLCSSAKFALANLCRMYFLFHETNQTCPYCLILNKGEFQMQEKKGYVSFVLHAHLPFIHHPESEDYLEEQWLFEAMSETYIPLILNFQKSLLFFQPIVYLKSLLLHQKLIKCDFYYIFL